ncbi:MAG TPA: bifunctional UDP-2,4-diacetamido-2,4,6-trideoxy-beta-L-altropyranose hydrolase/GNAT family N-acetyltransferase [Ferruginibacter sp.]|nr:bifunctional UDP-2,4-diacetamido-2,4,6-trideoxy-beta-L-altropyranose hydrolase/GNAT family N-acetyltransferase [Ferruginibacter sp.]HMP19657.1 bifunctional UDP-2,4-diacetamido-2,4,6-trideoxy-beta-L-altropyranose hydrolase/GNAT family N-acetyltransferase [Ferruginibacter sp.]
MMQKIVFRADGSPEIGYGHMYRMLALLKMLYTNWQCFFVSDSAPFFLSDELKSMSVPLLQVVKIKYPLPDTRKPGDEIPFDMETILTGNEIVVLDGYWFGKKYQQAIKSKGCTLVYIDDLIEAGNIADIVINHSPGVNIGQYQDTAPGTAIYTGSAYSLVQAPDMYRNKTTQGKLFGQLLLAMGGADPLNYTCTLLQEQQPYISRFDAVKIIVGNAFPHIQQLKDSIAAFPQAEILQALSKTEVYAVMQKSTVAILSASTMAMEYAAVGGLLSVIQTAQNQKYLYKGLIDEKIALPLSELYHADEAICSAMMEKQRHLFDGKAGERFVRLFNELQLQASLSFIKAAKEHLDITYQWAANATVRAYSFNQNPIPFQEHQDWYLQKIEQDSCVYLLAKLGDAFIGSLRFDIKEGKALISYLVAPEQHGRGLGKVLLAKGLNYFAQINTTATHATGYVLPQNTASVKVFERLGFTCSTETNQLCYTKKLNH